MACPVIGKIQHEVAGPTNRRDIDRYFGAASRNTKLPCKSPKSFSMGVCSATIRAVFRSTPRRSGCRE